MRRTYMLVAFILLSASTEPGLATDAAGNLSQTVKAGATEDNKNMKQSSDSLDISDHVATVQLDRKLPYAGEPIQFLVCFPREWAGDQPRPMLRYSVLDESGKRIAGGITIGIPTQGGPTESRIVGDAALAGLPAGNHELRVELRNDQNPSRPITGGLIFEVIDPDRRHILALPWQYVKDYTVIWADGVFHAFGLVGRADERQDWQEEGLQNEKQFFHATSKDLAHWTQHEDILHCPASGYDDRGVWAPHVFKHEDLYWMFYTGTQKGVVQRLCAATSRDLFQWTRRPENPLMSADKTDWAAHTDGGWTDYRDPMVLRDDDNDRWIAYNVAKTKEGHGSVAAAFSKDLINWEDAGPVYTGPYIPESPFVWKMGSRYYLSINAGGRGIYVSDSLLGPFTEKLDPDPFPQNVMAYEVLQTAPNRWLLSGFAWEKNGNYIEFFEMSVRDGKPVISRDLSEILGTGENGKGAHSEANLR